MNAEQRNISTTVTVTPSDGSVRRIAIAIDLSDESAYAVGWAVQNYLRPGDTVILLYIRPTDVLYGADWGSIQLQINNSGGGESNSYESATEETQQKLEDDFSSFTTSKANTLAQPLVEAQIPFKIHIVKDHDMKERLCLEVERLGLSVVIMGSRGFGAARKSCKLGKLGSFSDYCVHHCVCPVVVVRYPDEKDGRSCERKSSNLLLEETELHPVPEEEHEYYDAED